VGRQRGQWRDQRDHALGARHDRHLRGAGGGRTRARAGGALGRRAGRARRHAGPRQGPGLRRDAHGGRADAAGRGRRWQAGFRADWAAGADDFMVQAQAQHFRRRRRPPASTASWPARACSAGGRGAWAAAAASAAGLLRSHRVAPAGQHRRDAGRLGHGVPAHARGPAARTS
jgi:hypothetical protein